MMQGRWMCVVFAFVLVASAIAQAVLDPSVQTSGSINGIGGIAEYKLNVQSASAISFTVFPCKGAIDWAVSFNEIPSTENSDNDFNYHFPNGHVHAPGEDSDDEDEPVVQTFSVSSPNRGDWYIAVKALDAFVNFQILVTNSLNPLPKLPDNPHIGWYPNSPTTLQIDWLASPSPNVQYCLYLHPDSSHENDDVHGSPCGVESEDLIVCGDQHLATVNNLLPETEYHIDVIVKSLDTGFANAYLDVEAFTLPTPVQLDINTWLDAAIDASYGRQFYQFAVGSNIERAQITVEPCVGEIDWSVDLATVPDTNDDDGLFSYHFPSPHEHVFVVGSDGTTEEHTDINGKVVQSFVLSNPAPGTYNLVVAALELSDGEIAEYKIYFTTDSESPFPAAGDDGSVNVDVDECSLLVQLSWSPASGTTSNIDYCIYAHLESDHDDFDVHESPCGVDPDDLIGCTADTSFSWTVERAANYHCDVIAEDRNNGFMTAYDDFEIVFDGECDQSPSPSSTTATLLPTVPTTPASTVFSSLEIPPSDSLDLSVNGSYRIATNLCLLVYSIGFIFLQLP